MYNLRDVEGLGRWLCVQKLNARRSRARDATIGLSLVILACLCITVLTQLVEGRLYVGVYAFVVLYDMASLAFLIVRVVTMGLSIVEVSGFPHG